MVHFSVCSVISLLLCLLPIDFIANRKSIYRSVPASTRTRQYVNVPAATTRKVTS
jgi:hypothetical protein